MATYRTVGVHTRTENGEFKVYPHNTEIVPTKLELAMFPNKFKPQVDYVPPVEEDDDEDDKGTGNAGGQVDVSKLDEARAKLAALIEADEYEASVIDEAKKFMSKRPEKQHTIDALTADIEKFLSELEEDDEEE